MQRKRNNSYLILRTLIGFLFSIIVVMSPALTSNGWADELLQANQDVSDFESIHGEERNVKDDGLPMFKAGEEPSRRPEDRTAARLFYDRMVYIMGNLRNTQYVHTSEKVMNEDEGIYNYDCSGFVGEFILKQASRKHYRDLVDNAERFHNDSRPRAWGFYDYFREILGDDAVENNNDYWYVFISYKNIQPGDIIVARYDTDWRDFIIGECGKASTGHVMVAWSVPDDEPEIEDEFSIYVIDSSGSGHGEDTRKTDFDNVYDEDGIGKGKMWFGYNYRDRPIYYRWSEYNGCKYTLDFMDSNCGNESHDTNYCPGEGDHNHKYFERLEGIIMARPIFKRNWRRNLFTRQEGIGSILK